MKRICVLLDEPLLRRLDADPDVQRLGRSEVLRRAVSEYLSPSRSARVGRRYRRAYEGVSDLGDEWSGWEEEGSPPAVLEPIRELRGFVQGIDSSVPR